MLPTAPVRRPIRRTHDQRTVRRSHPEPRRRFALSLLLALALTGCGGKGCVELTTAPPKPTVPDALLLNSGAAARVTQHGFDVVAAQIVDLLGLLFGKTASGAAKIDVGSLLGPVELSVGGGLGLFEGKASVRDLVLSLDMDALTIQLVDGSSPARLRLGFDHAHLGVVSGVVAGGSKVLGIGTDAACHLLNGLDVGKSTERVATVSATVDVVLGIDAKGGLDLDIEVADPVLHAVGFRLGMDCKLPECTDKVLAEDPCLECNLCAAGELGSAAISGLTNLLGPLLGDLLEVATGLLLDAVILPGLNGQPIDVEVPIDLRATLAASNAALLALLGPGEPLRARVRPRKGAFSVQAGALLVRLDAAVLASAHPCARDPGPDAAPGFATLPLSPPPALPATIATAAGQETVDLGLLLGTPLIEQAVWAALRSGLLCVRVDSAGLYGLSGGSLILSAAALDLVVPGLRRVVSPDAAIRVVLSPSAAPAPPTRVGLESLPGGALRLRLRMADAGVLIEADARWRWLTLVEARADLDVSIELRVVGNSLSLRVEHVDLAELDIEDAALVDAAGLPALAPALVDLAVGLLLAEPIDLDIDLATLLDGLGLPLVARPLGVGALGADDWLWVAVGLDLVGGTK
ncbi:MAG: hypothetical protein RIT45_3802 [Pseudomonadota bacterium]